MARRFAPGYSVRSPGLETHARIHARRHPHPGLGIGATTAILSVVNTVLLRSLPYPESDRLVQITEVAPPPEPGKPPPPRVITYAQFAEWRSRTTTMEIVAATRWDPQVMAPTPRGMARLSGGLVTPEWFAMLGTPAMLGRTLVPADLDGGRSVVVLSARAWRQYSRIRSRRAW